MTCNSYALSGLMITLPSMSGVQAQVTIDVAKITCEQFTQYKITNDESVAIWLSGYYNGNTIIDPQTIKTNAGKVRTYCIMTPDVTVMQAIETVLGTNK
jgi:hypothetical protein